VEREDDYVRVGLEREDDVSGVVLHRVMVGDHEAHCLVGIGRLDLLVVYWRRDLKAGISSLCWER